MSRDTNGITDWTDVLLDVQVRGSTGLYTVKAHAVLGHWAITPVTNNNSQPLQRHRINGRTVKGTRYTITHVATGLKTGPVMCLRDAMATLVKLRDIKVLSSADLVTQYLPIVQAHPAKVRTSYAPRAHNPTIWRELAPPSEGMKPLRAIESDLIPEAV